MVTQIVCGGVFLVSFLSAVLRVFAEYHDFVNGVLIPVASMLIVSMLTVAGTFRIRNEVIRYALTLAFTLHQVFIHFFVEFNTVWIEASAIFSVGAIFGIRGFVCWMQNRENGVAAGGEGAGGADEEAVQQIEDRIREAMKFIIFNYIAAFCIALISMILNIKCIRIEKNHKDNTDKILKMVNSDKSKYSIPILICLAVPCVTGHIPLYWKQTLHFLAWCNTQRQVFQGWCNDRWQEFQRWCNNRWELFQAWQNAQMEHFQNWWNIQIQNIQNCWAGIGNWWNVWMHDVQNCLAGLGNCWNVQSGVERSTGNEERGEEESAGVVVELEHVGTRPGGVAEPEQVQVMTDN